ncbi:MAG: hypothetical protein WAS49_05550 [Candidatus Dechloromonas phosphoritropha]
MCTSTSSSASSIRRVIFKVPWLLTELGDECETFLAEVHVDRTIYLSDPRPGVPVRTSAKGKAPT